MKKLTYIIENLPIETIIGTTDSIVDELCFDSRQAKADSCFFAISGTAVDGHSFIENVIEKGAIAIICEVLPQTISNKVTYIQVKSSSFALGICAANFYGNPSEKLQLVGITGTNGKTTTVTLLHQLFEKLGHTTGLLSTIQNKIGNRIVAATHTTPDPIQLNKLLSEMVDEGCTHAFMEVSSHSIVQHRIAGLHFAGGIFSNITHDHLDYHKTFETYIKAKKAFFDELPKTAFALSNIDDRNGEVMLQNSKAKKHTYALKSMADFRCKIIENAFSGLHLLINNADVYCRLVGTFNAYNFLAIYATAVLLGEDSQNVLAVMSNLQSAEGRFDTLKSSKGIVAIVDYAHTPDALENVLSTISNVRNGNETLITVVGCGGDRDKSKRPIMAKIASKMSDKVILTSDNPRTEDPQSILDQMNEGVEIADKSKVLTILNREEAIRTACMIARPNDIILVAGKGHEKYQEINGIRHHFDDKEKLMTTLNIN
ncbi:MAG: UDP-N-acetylmuramoyl-L-alanyl-D-glutamate--2,6-diaminopimelate ligase [Bacteroidales bacterium]|jgi:UDP-N-acetylmuramoyl-L-alanyl-D-glutamate--2,6-diaminopimelate ligase|nr:UDP-N-acetylmuramoyl-L-alanyl-D-glutamate--2,6-diaminopimelate ligase [Bacteroidales bacterium]